jgi:hypothetical protein
LLSPWVFFRGGGFETLDSSGAEAATYVGTEMATEAAATVREVEERAAMAMGVKAGMGLEATVMDWKEATESEEEDWEEEAMGWEEAATVEEAKATDAATAAAPA